WNTLAFRGRLMSLLVLTHCGVSSRPLGLRLLAPPKTFLPLESRVFQLLGWVFILNELLLIFNSSKSISYVLKLIHPIIIYMILSFVNSKRYIVDWNGRRRLQRE